MGQRQCPERDHRTSVRESIHAVESAVKDFTDDPSAVLSKAVRSLVVEIGVHKALADAFIWYSCLEMERTRVPQGMGLRQMRLARLH